MRDYSPVKKCAVCTGKDITRLGIKITYRKSMWEIVTVMKTEPCDTLRNAKPTKENLVQIMTSKRRKHAVAKRIRTGNLETGKTRQNPEKHISQSQVTYEK